MTSDDIFLGGSKSTVDPIRFLPLKNTNVSGENNQNGWFSLTINKGINNKGPKHQDLRQQIYTLNLMNVLELFFVAWTL